MAQASSSSNTRCSMVREEPRWGRLLAAAVVSMLIAGAALSVAPPAALKGALLRSEPRPPAAAAVDGSAKPRMMRREVPTTAHVATEEKKERPKAWGKFFRKEEAPKVAALPSGQQASGTPSLFKSIGAVLSVLALATFALQAKNLVSGGLSQVAPNSLKGKAV
eukprot:TRINITY_DN1499_c0_g1_i8.p1 TRINITY_DN1499_c0_g1~~TRINITY_DN1499_c0_g1_i8.p1  ORF type:complete len:191 (+),score=39.71 TRINITY_DN1499_c0_g1_i8:83-574(+)